MDDLHSHFRSSSDAFTIASEGCDDRLDVRGGLIRRPQQSGTDVRS